MLVYEPKKLINMKLIKTPRGTPKVELYEKEFFNFGSKGNIFNTKQ